MEQNETTQPPSLRPLMLFGAIFLAFQLFSFLAMSVSPDMFVAVISAQIIVILGGAILYERKFARTPIKLPSLTTLGMPVWAVVVVTFAAISLGLLGNILAAATVELIPPLREVAEAYQQAIERLLLGEGLRPQILGAISVAIVAPFCEEYFFRRTLLAEQRYNQSIAIVVLLNGLLFSAMHVNPVAFVSLTLIGCFLAHITIHSGAIWGAIIAHAALNTVNGVILPRVAMDMASPDDYGATEILIGLAILAPVTFGLWWVSIRAIKTSTQAAPV